MTNKSKRNRSPSYPAFDLETAVEKLKEFYQKEGFNETLADVAIQGWGYAEGSSNGYRAISALIQYGLLEDQGSGDDRVVYLTELGKTIAIDEREDSGERKEALQTASKNPSVFKKLWEKYGADLPSDASLKYYLIRELEFNQKHVGRFIKCYKSTLDFSGLNNSSVGSHVGEEKSEIESNSVEENLNNETKKVIKNAPLDENTKLENKDNLSIPIPLINGRQASLSLPIPLTEADFKMIKNLITVYLDNMKPAIVKNEKEGPA